MTPRDFITKWSGSTLTERSGSQQHFLDLCRLLDEPTPADVDQTGETYTFEKGTTKTAGGRGWADVWKRGHFAWEYKGKHKDLTAAFAQLQRYAIALENPPLLILGPLLAEWGEVKANIEAEVRKSERAKSKSAATTAWNRAQKRHQAFLYRLSQVRVLDPACGSGNFLYLALLGLKDLEHRVNLEAEALGLEPHYPAVGPDAMLGIELSPYAAELARVTVWVGEIQWMLKHGFSLSKNPILKRLDMIDCRDAVVTPEGLEPEWPEAEFIVGNPPFLGDKKMIGELGEEYVNRLRMLYKGRVPGGADLVTYWFEKTRAQIEAGKTRLAGLVATNSIRGGANRKVLERICNSGRIFTAWSDEPWINEGAAVRVSLVGFVGKDGSESTLLDGKTVGEVYANLTAGGSTGVDLTQAKRLDENAGTCFEGIKKYGDFDISGSLARSWLGLDGNPHAKPNSDVLYLWMNAKDLVRRSSDTWVIDFGSLSEVDASYYETPFSHVLANVKPSRDKDRNKKTRENWWRFERARPALRERMIGLPRYIATPVVAKHRVFAWLPGSVLPSNLLDAIARSDDTTFGILHSRFHELWALRTCTWLGKGNDPRYTPTTTFETFPFPEGLTPNIPAEDYADDPRARAIAEAARRLVELRDNWLNPPEWVQRVPEVVPGYPDRLVPVDDKAAKALKKRTLTNLYNQRPAWLQHAHEALDAAVAAAYGWEADIEEGEVLRRLLALNQERATAQ